MEVICEHIDRRPANAFERGTMDSGETGPTHAAARRGPCESLSLALGNTDGRVGHTNLRSRTRTP